MIFTKPRIAMCKSWWVTLNIQKKNCLLILPKIHFFLHFLLLHFTFSLNHLRCITFDPAFYLFRSFVSSTLTSVIAISFLKTLINQYFGTSSYIYVQIYINCLSFIPSLNMPQFILTHLNLNLFSQIVVNYRSHSYTTLYELISYSVFSYNSTHPL